jgi:low affinity Fe/Cu permease
MTGERMKKKELHKFRHENYNHNQHSYFSKFSKIVSDHVGRSWCFIIALGIVILWLISGPLFHFSDTWQLVINTGTTIITFLMVFLIQNTQNRDTRILNLKLDELIKSSKSADDSSIDLTKLSDEDLKKLEEHYIKLCNKHTRK